MVAVEESVEDSLLTLASSLRVDRIIGALVSVLRSRKVREASRGGMELSIRTSSTTSFLDSCDKSDSSL